MKQVYLLYKFNAYRNRQIKRFSTVADYLSAAYDYDAPPNQKNFAYNDGVNTEMTIKQDPGAKYSPDYCLIVDKDGNIESRWYVVESDKLMDTSYKLRLHRDLIADNFDDILNAPAFIEKATVNPADPYIFNQEQITVNQIKKSEKLLKDKSKVAWIVGYMAKNAVQATETINFGPKRIPDYAFNDESGFLNGFPSALVNSIKFDNVDPGSSLPTSPGTLLKQARKYEVRVGWLNTASTVLLNFYYNILRAQWAPDGQIDILGNNQGYSNSNDAQSAFPNIVAYPFHKSGLSSNTIANDVCNGLNAYRAAMATEIQSRSAMSFTSPFALYNDKIFRIGTKYYRTKIISSSSSSFNQAATMAANENNAVINAIKAQGWDQYYEGSAKSVEVGYQAYEQYLLFEDITSGQYEFKLTGNEYELNNEPFKMFAIPYSRDGSITVGTVGQFYMDGEIGLLIANALSSKYSGDGALYDVQLLPYCPISVYVEGDHELLIPSVSDEYTLIKDGDNHNAGIIYWCTENTFTFDITESIIINDVKMESITDKHRLSSPNWNGQFEFNAAKNGGVSKFNVDCTYKPFTPYIHVNPNFGRLYGEDFDDARGLICSGDFSLPQIRNEWQTYELQNKNYQNQFDRQIENLELTQDVNLKKQRIAAAVNTVSGTVSGAMTGGLIGGVGGAIAGGIIGGTASAVGAAADDYYTRLLNNETIDYAQDQFRMRNENIQALPDTLKQVGALTANNKLFPVLEYYSCTDEEKAAVALKLQYNGMTVERIGTISEFIQATETYIKAKLIRLNLEEDNHYLEAIAQELNKGVFIKS